MIAVKPIAQIAQKYVTRAAAAQGDYQSGVQNTPASKWETATTAAADSYSQGVQQAVATGRFASGVSGQGAKWQRKATTLGPSRYAAGVQGAQSDYQSGFQKYADALTGLTLNPRGPRGDMRNYARSQQVGDALHTVRTQS